MKLLCYRHGEFFKRMLDEGTSIVDFVITKSYFKRFAIVRNYLSSGEQDVVISFLDTPNFLACISAIGRRKWILLTNEAKF